jgi:phosphatidylserine decarboxylase
MVPVGATNVGSIKINFDQVNTLTGGTGGTR